MHKVCKALALAGAMISLASTVGAQPTPGGLVEVPGGKLWVESCGAGPRTLVLLHDGVLHSATWDDVWPALCKSFHVIRYDRRGYGRSPEAKAPYSRVDDLQAVMRTQGVGRAVIVGASAGGGLAIDFTLAHPDEVERLVVVGPAVSGLPYSRHFTDRMSELNAQMGRGDMLGALKGSWAMAPGDDANAKRLLALLMASPQDLNHRDPATAPPPAAPRLSEIKAPTLVLVGEEDIADNQSQAGVVEYAVPGARRVVVRNAGHMLYMEQPAQFVEVVTRFAEGG
ncbi:MAG: alpha/beta hydrolase [Caulobacteraceae bacterium]